MRRQSKLGLIGAFTLIAAYPNETLGQSSPVVVRDSAGVRIVESTTPLWAAGRGWTVAATPTLQIGRVDGPPDQVLYRVGAIRRLPDGGLLVANEGVEVRRYDATGRLLWTTGRNGTGPGDFRGIGEFFVGGGDSIEVFEGALRLTILAPNGALGRVVTLNGTRGSGQTLGKLTDGSIVISTLATTRTTLTGPYRTPETFRRLNLTTAKADSLFSVPGIERFNVTDADGCCLLATQAFARMTLTGVRGSQLLTAENDRFELRSFDTSGQLQQIARRAFDADPVTAEDIRAWKALAQSAIARTTNPGTSARLQTRLALMTFPPTRPVLALQPMFVDALGDVWLPQYPDDADFAAPTEYTVFNPAGRWLGVVRMPPRFRVSDIGADYIAGKFTDELGVEYVRVYALRKP